MRCAHPVPQTLNLLGFLGNPPQKPLFRCHLKFGQSPPVLPKRLVRERLLPEKAPDIPAGTPKISVEKAVRVQFLQVSARLSNGVTNMRSISSVLK